jgi:transcriptional regulator with XRE-family HTH domain
MFKGFRFRRGLTVGDFAEQAGVAEEQIREWERRAAMPTKAELQDIATAFNTSIFELLEPSHTLAASSGTQPTLPFYEWDAQHQQRWGALPYLLWGYLKLQLTPDDAPRWYPVSCEQAASINKQLHKPGWTTMIVALTQNNRCVMFAPQRIFRASLIDTGTAAGDPSFRPEWDADGHPPEFYRALRAWAQKDFAARAGTSFALAMRVLNFRQSGTTYTRKKIAALVGPDLFVPVVFDGFVFVAALPDGPALEDFAATVSKDCAEQERCISPHIYRFRNGQCRIANKGA